MSGTDCEIFFRVAVAERADWPIEGNDTGIAALRTQPPLGALKVLALELAETWAANLGTRFHHGNFVITSNPHTVMQRGIMPEHRDCSECRAGLADALVALAHNPDLILVVGQLHWSPRPP